MEVSSVGVAFPKQYVVAAVKYVIVIPENNAKHKQEPDIITITTTLHEVSM